MDGTALLVETAPHDPYLGTRVLDQFRLVRVVGSGGMGVVYEGLDERLDRRVAVKILHRDLITNKDVVSRFHREAQIAHQLDHPGIVRVILFGQLPDGNLYLVLEFLEGPTLGEALDRDHVFSPARTVRIIAHVAEAIGYAHARGIVHRDLKPDNIILTTRESDPEYPKVLDFGIAKMLIGSGTFVTQTGLIFGTALYISPEGAAGEAVDQRGDVYSLGVIAYQLLTGHTPFEADEPVQLLIKHMHEPVPLMNSRAGSPKVPPAIEAVVMRALAKNPAARQPDGIAFGRALREALDSPGPAPDLRSIVATSSMPFFAEDAQPAAIPAPLAPEGSGSPVAVAVGSGVQQIRRVVRPASGPVRAVGSGAAEVRASHSGSAPGGVGTGRALPAVILSGSLTPEAPAQAVPRTVMQRARVEIPAIQQPPAPAPATPPGAATQNGRPPSVHEDLDDVHIAGMPRSRRATPAGAEIADPDDITVAGIPHPRRGRAARTAVVIFVSAALALSAALGAAWLFRMLPDQRHTDEIAALVFRAGDALQAGRFVHTTDTNNVEDLTSAVLALDAANARALQLRHTAATRLQAEAEAEHTAGRLERSAELLQYALRLVNDPGIHDDLSVIQTEIDLRRNPAHAIAPNGRPVSPHPPFHHGPVARPGPDDPSLVHAPQPAVPVLPPTRSPEPRAPEPRTPPHDHGVSRPMIQAPSLGPAFGPTPPPQPPPPIPPRAVFTPSPTTSDPTEPQNF